jgi:hypothetical protein
LLLAVKVNVKIHDYLGCFLEEFYFAA